MKKQWSKNLYLIITKLILCCLFIYSLSFLLVQTSNDFFYNFFLFLFIQQSTFFTLFLFYYFLYISLLTLTKHQI